MWRAECQQCKWTSTVCTTKRGTDVLGHVHEKDNPDHLVIVIEVRLEPPNA